MCLAGMDIRSLAAFTEQIAAHALSTRNLADSASVTTSLSKRGGVDKSVWQRLDMTRTRATFLILACVVAAALLVLAPATLQAQDRFRGRLQVSTYNIHHGTGNDVCTPPAPSVPPRPDCGFNLDRIAATIRSFDSDIVALQEVGRFWARSAYTDQPVLLATTLEMQVCYGANLNHAPDTHAVVPHQYGTAILSRYPILECKNTLLPQPSGTEQRGLLEVLVSVEGTPIRIYNTHLHTTNPARQLQTQAIPLVIGAPAEPVILVGDFNALPTAPEMAPIYAQFDDAWMLAGMGPGDTLPADLEVDPDRRIDYVFVSRATVEVVWARVPVDDETRISSDHYPVTSSVRFP